MQILQCQLMATTLAARRLRQLEGKVATLSVINDALQKENDTLREVRAPDCVVGCCSSAVHGLLQAARLLSAVPAAEHQHRSATRFWATVAERGGWGGGARCRGAGGAAGGVPAPAGGGRQDHRRPEGKLRNTLTVFELLASMMFWQTIPACPLSVKRPMPLPP
jgi:hypothetical protein